MILNRFIQLSLVFGQSTTMPGQLLPSTKVPCSVSTRTGQAELLGVTCSKST